MNCIELLVIQSTSFCNIDCDYCYLPNRSIKGVMSEKTLIDVLTRAFSSKHLGENLTLVWHAGEPLAAGINFYKNAYELCCSLCPKDKTFNFSFQTNGTLINEEWCRFFCDTTSRVGVSLDGPKFIHDLQRVNRRGEGTFEAVMAGISTLKRFGVPHHFIAVVTNESLPYAKEIYDFFRNLGYPWAFNVEEIEGSNRRRSFKSTEFDTDLYRFYRSLFRCWALDENRLRIRELNGIVNVLASHLSRPNQESRPISIVNVDVNGRFSTFSPELLGQTTSVGEFLFGDCKVDTFESMLSNEKYISVSKEIERGILKCRESCEFFAFCGGGSPSSKWFELGRFDGTETRFCNAHIKIFVSAVLDELDSDRILFRKSFGKIVA